MTYQVVAPLVLAKDQSGHTHHIYRGGLVPWLSKEQAEHFLGENLVVKVGAKADEPEQVADDAGKPGEDAHKPELVEWVYNNVAKEDGSDYTKTELNKLSPDELRAIVDSVE